MQVDYALKDLQLDDLDKIMVAMEVLARLAWSDDEVSHSSNFARPFFCIAIQAEPSCLADNQKFRLTMKKLLMVHSI